MVRTLEPNARHDKCAGERQAAHLDRGFTRREFLRLGTFAGLGGLAGVALEDTMLSVAGVPLERLRRLAGRVRWTFGRPLRVRNAIGGMMSRAYAYELDEIGVEITRPTLHVAGLPAALDGFVIAQVTDIHVGPDLDGDAVAAVVARVNALVPDMVALTGDFIRGHSDLILPCAEALEGLEAPYGSFAVLGNHEIWSGADVIAPELSAAGVHVLRDDVTSVSVGDAELFIIGIEDSGYTGYTGGSLEPLAARWRHKVDRLNDLLQQTDGHPRVLLVHNPDANELLDPERPIDLALSGHTHGGQVRLPFLGAPYMPSVMGQKYRGGFATGPAGVVYVNRGIGVTGIPLRFNCPPEITLLTLKASDGQSAG